jgi:hypothetical protein
MEHYDIIIIGAGLAGLYSAYNIMKINPTKTFIIIERDKKEWIGGRIGNDTFYNTHVVVGAGIGRQHKDYLLIQLLKNLHIKTKECDIQMNYAKTICKIADVDKIIHFLKKEYEKYKIKPNQTFSQFAKNKLGEELYSWFTISAGYTDYENEDIYESLYHYGMDDNHPGWKSLIIPWKELVLKLCSKIGMQNIKYKTDVTKIVFMPLQDPGFLIETNKRSYTCNKVIVATNITSILKLVPGADAKNSLYQQIHGQPFLRVYGKFPKMSAKIMQQYVPFQTIVPGPLHKIIPLENGVYMIAYTDNQGALALKDHLENNEKNRRLFENLLEVSLGIPPNSLYLTAIKGYYWPIGTHYYGPLEGFPNRKDFIEKAQHPFKNMLVVGEVVSRNQGWTEGALESVHSVLNKQWINAYYVTYKND